MNIEGAIISTEMLEVIRDFQNKEDSRADMFITHIDYVIDNILNNPEALEHAKESINTVMVLRWLIRDIKTIRNA